MNLLKETVEVLKANGKKPEDVKWCGSSKFGWFSWSEFTRVADVEYDNGFGASEVAIDLVIVGKDWWLERGEYDGSEWWEFKTLPSKPKIHRVPRQVIVPDELIGEVSLIEIEDVVNKEENMEKIENGTKRVDR